MTERAGDILQIGIPGVAGVSTLIWNDPFYNRTKEFVKSMSCSVATTLILKFVVDKERPNGGSYSFPSGHTSTAFCGAAFICKSYGWKAGIPAMSLASYVAWSRIYNNKHDLADIIGGIIIGTGSAILFTDTAFQKNISIGVSPKNASLSINVLYIF